MRTSEITFWLLAVMNVFVGGMVGLERTLIPLLGQQLFSLEAGAALAAFIISFSISKAVMNLFAGLAADYVGRKRVLIIGWVIGLPVPLLLIWAPTWSWVLVANVLLGINQALTWSMTVNMMVDLVSAERRGFAAGINEFAGYLGVSVLAALTGVVAASFNLRPEPFYIGVAIAILGLILAFMLPETAPKMTAPAIRWVRGTGVPSVLGCATNLKDGLVWLTMPLIFSARGWSLTQISMVTALYPLLWAVGQLLFGPLSDRVGRRPLIALGMAFQGVGLILLALVPTFLAALIAATILGIATAMVYPTLIASVADRVPHESRATALGMYRFFRDGGYALGAVLAGASLSVLPVALPLIGAGMIVLALWAWWQL